MTNNPTKIPLTVYIRTHNEEERVGPVIRRAIEIGAEVIVVDDCSTDTTQQIAKNEGAKVIEQKWLGGGTQKRVAEDAASNEWLLDLDADELLSSELQAEIVDHFKGGAPAPGLFSLKYVTVPPVPKGCIWQNAGVDRRCKFYHKSIVRMPDHPAWDQFKIPKGIKPEALKNSIYHYSFLNIEQQMHKMNKASSRRAYGTKLKPKWYLALRILFAFPIYFSKKYFKQRMFLAGIYGFSCAAVIASNRWLKDVKMYELHLEKNGRNEI